MKVDPTNISREALNKLNTLSTRILNKNINDTSSEELDHLLNIDEMFSPKTLTISVSSTRKTEVQYCTNNYVAAMTIDVSPAAIIDIMASPDPTIEEYLRAKEIFFTFVKEKILSAEHFLRSTLREAEAKDGIAGQGRFSNS